MAPRKRKRGTTRMDAAIDALAPMGFEEKLVRKKVNSFLKVYGDSGWPFIEEFSYKMVIDSLCEDQVNESMEKNDESMEVEVATEEPHPEPQPLPEPQPEPQPLPEPQPEPQPLPEPQQEPQPQPEAQPDKDQEVINCLPLVPTPPRRSRNSCYGWICSDNEDDDIITLATEVSQMCARELRKERKTRWDVKPEDM